MKLGMKVSPVILALSVAVAFVWAGIAKEASL
jgi:hypothetical protein